MNSETISSVKNYLATKNIIDEDLNKFGFE